jgi:hypothetical protein
VQADGKILAGGAFTSISGQTPNRIARLDATTGLADSLFDPNANGGVNSIAVQASGKILVRGNVTSIRGQTRKFIARLGVSRAINLSTRMRVQTGDSVGIGGFIITGTVPKHVLLRAIGPSLAGFGVPDTLA